MVSELNSNKIPNPFPDIDTKPIYIIFLQLKSKHRIEPLYGVFHFLFHNMEKLGKRQ